MDTSQNALNQNIQEGNLPQELPYHTHNGIDSPLIDTTANAAVVHDTQIIFTDNTTNDASASKHGFVPKLSGDVNQYYAGDGTFTNITNATGITNHGSQSSAVTFDLSTVNKHMVTLTGTVTISLTGGTVGQVFLVRLIQDGTGSRTVTWFTTIKWPANTSPTLTTTANKIDVFGFLCTSSGNYDGFIIGQNL